MFIDSDINTRGFDGGFGEDIGFEGPNFIGGLFNSNSSLGGASLNCPTNTTLKNFIIKYNIKPGYVKFKNGNVAGCSSFTGAWKCTDSKMIGCYGTNSEVTQVFDEKALTQNGYNYNLQQMVDKLANVQSEVNALVPVNSNMTCLEYDNAVSALNTAQINWNSAIVTNLYDRDLRAAFLGGIANAMSTVTSYMDARDCTGATSAIDTSQQAAAAAAQAQAQAESEAASQALQAESDALQASQSAEAIRLSVEAETKRVERQTNQNIQAIKDDNKATLDNIEIQATLAKEETDKRNKMMMFGAAVIILVLVLKK